MKKNILLGAIVTLTASSLLVGSTFAFAKGRRGPFKDTNGDGVVTKSEAVSNAEEKFKRRDTNGDGVITKEEVTARVETKFDQIDANKDGQITQEEKQSYRRAKHSRQAPQ